MSAPEDQSQDWPAQNITCAASLCYVDGVDTALKITHAAAVLLRTVSSAALKKRSMADVADLLEWALLATTEAERLLIDICADELAEVRRHES